MPSINELDTRNAFMVSIKRKPDNSGHIIRYKDHISNEVLSVLYPKNGKGQVYSIRSILPFIRYIDSLSLDSNGVVRWSLHCHPHVKGKYVPHHMELKLPKCECKGVDYILTKVALASMLEMEIIDFTKDMMFLDNPTTSHSYAKLTLGSYPRLYRKYTLLTAAYTDQEARNIPYRSRQRLIKLFKDMKLGLRSRTPKGKDFIYRTPEMCTDMIVVSESIDKNVFTTVLRGTRLGTIYNGDN